MRYRYGAHRPNERITAPGRRQQSDVQGIVSNRAQKTNAARLQSADEATSPKPTRALTACNDPILGLHISCRQLSAW